MGSQATLRHLRDLTVWKKAMELVKNAYRATSTFPDTERFGLAMQMRRTSVSIPGNVAEGQGRSSTREFRRFLGHARGSLCEIVTRIEIAADLGFLDDDRARRLLALAEAVGSSRNALLRSLGGTTAREDPDLDFQITSH
jgi:four helix bundle protein